MKRNFIPMLLGALIILLILSMLYAPQFAQPLGNGLLVVFLALALWTIIRRRWGAHQRGEATRNQTFLRLFLDVLGLALAFVSATWLGKLVGDWAAVFSSWAGILVGGLACFLVASSVAKLWGRFNV
jgi:Ca2+/Na+ antiporter